MTGKNLDMNYQVLFHFDKAATKSRENIPSRFLTNLDIIVLTIYFKETPFNAFANRADPDQVALVCSWKYDISDPTQVDLTGNFFVLCTNLFYVPT